MKNLLIKIVAPFICLGLVAAQSQAMPTAQLGGTTLENIVASENFDGLLSGSYQATLLNSGGFSFSILPSSGSLVVWNYSGLGFGTNGLYQNGGAVSMTSIKFEDSSEFDQLQFDVGNGYSSIPQPAQYVWLRTYLNGMPTGFDFDFNAVAKGSTFTVAGGGFDEVRVQSYNSPFAHDESEYGGVAIDNVIASSGKVPEPSIIALFGLGMLGFVTSLRKSAKSKNA